MSASPWFQFYPTDWLAGTADLTAMERGVYITLLALMYDRGGPLPIDHARLSRRCNMTGPAFLRALESLIREGKITSDGEKISNPRVENELSATSSRRENAKNSANSRWVKVEQKQQSVYATASVSHMLPEPEPESELKKELSSLRSDSCAAPPSAAPPPPIKTPTRDLLESTEADPNAKPLKVGARRKSAAEEREVRHMLALLAAAYPQGKNVPARDNPDGWWASRIKLGVALKNGATIDEIVEGARRYAASGPNPEYVFNPTNWLDRGKWRDELKKPAPADSGDPQQRAPPAYGSPSQGGERRNPVFAGSQILRQKIQEQRNATDRTIDGSCNAPKLIDGNCNQPRRLEDGGPESDPGTRG